MSIIKCYKCDCIVDSDINIIYVYNLNYYCKNCKKIKKDNKIMKNEKLQDELIYAIKNCYCNDVLTDLHNLFVEFDSNAETSSLKEFIKMERK